MKYIFSLIVLALSICAQAQYGKPVITAKDKLVPAESGIAPQPLQGTLIGFRNPPSEDGTWMPSLTKISDNESEDNELVEHIKEEANRQKATYRQQHSGNKGTATVAPPTLGANFEGIDNGGVNAPLDNTLAISDKDSIVVFVNSAIAYYTASGTRAYLMDIWRMIGDATIFSNLCDPKVIYDPMARRFIFYVQVCNKVAATSQVILGFSKTNNPGDGWYIYKFTGNPLGTSDWWDYPKMGLSTDELFVTGNLFQEGGGPFDRGAIYQIQKAPCYAGSTLTPANSKFYTSTQFSILPLSYGQKGSYGPGIYLVSTAGGTTGSTNIKFYEITNNIASGSAVLNTYDVTRSLYKTAGDASQLGSAQKLSTGDSRAQDGFYLHGLVHFVFNNDCGSGFCCIDYDRIAVSSLTLTSSTFSNVGNTDYVYPAVASNSNDSLDKSVTIAYEESGDGIFPRTCAVKTDQNMNWSAPLIVKNGESYNAEPIAGTTERWGDYTGMCKKYGDPYNSLWMAGMYSNPAHYWLQWIAQLNNGHTAVPQQPAAAENASVYPNPVVDFYHIRFGLGERQHVRINLTDMAGRTVADLYDGTGEEGENMFVFNKANLPPGTYSLNIVGEHANIKNEKLVMVGR